MITASAMKELNTKQTLIILEKSRLDTYDLGACQELPVCGSPAYASTDLEKLDAVVRRCYVKKMFLKILQNSQENICVKVEKETLAQMFSCEFCEIFKNTFL